jgi:hypothetical protein
MKLCDVTPLIFYSIIRRVELKFTCFFLFFQMCVGYIIKKRNDLEIPELVTLINLISSFCHPQIPNVPWQEANKQLFLVFRLPKG